MHEQTAVALQTAEKVLTRKEKIEAAIAGEVAKLPAMLQSRLATEREFRKLECQQAIGESAAGLKEAKSAAESARGAVEEISRRVGGLRQNLGSTGSALVAAHAALKVVLPAHENTVIEAFNLEWEAACQQVSVLLGRRAEIEKLMKHKLQLPDPVATPADLGDMAVPYLKLSALEGAIASIVHLGKAAEGRQRFGNFPGLPSYDPASVYITVTERAGGVAPGTLVSAASYPDGELDVLVATGDAVIYRPIEVDEGVLAAATADKAIGEAREAERMGHSPYVPTGEDGKHSLPVPDPVYHPLAPDPEKIAAGIAEASEEREAQRAGFEAEQKYADRRQARADEQAAERDKVRHTEPAEPPKGKWPEGALL